MIYCPTFAHQQSLACQIMLALHPQGPMGEPTMSSRQSKRKDMPRNQVFQQSRSGVILDHRNGSGQLQVM
jgi:hypothetical protein